MSTLPVEGGPFDGIKARPLGGFVRWLSADGGAHIKPAPGRELYRRLSTKWVYAANHYRPCENCGAVLEREGPDWPSCICGR